MSEEKWKIPKAYRITPELATEKERELLAASDAQQKEWAENFDISSPQERMRANARILIDTLESLPELSDGQREILAENYAVLGRYDLAAQTTSSAEKNAIYNKYRQAVWSDESEWCNHTEKHKYIKENIYSVKLGEDAPLLACNVCDMWNVAPPPKILTDAKKKRAAHRAAMKGKSFDEIKRHYNK